MSARLLSGNNRKGQFFSLIAIMLLLLLALQLTSSEKTVLQTEAESTETSFEIAVNLLRNIETATIPRMLDADIGTAFDAIARCLNDSAAGVLDAEDDCYASNNGFYADETQVVGIVRNATLGLAVPPGVAPHTNKTNITDQINELQLFVPKKFKFGLTIQPGDLKVWQDNTSGPNGINVRMTGTLGLKADFAEWRGRVIEPNSTVAIDGLLDPYIMVQVERTLKSVSPHTASTVYKPRISYYQGNLTALTLQGLALNRSYQFDPIAPSFIARFTGNVSQRSSCCGIESLVALNPFTTTIAGVPPDVGLRRRSMVDWCYWREHTTDDIAWCTDPSFGSINPDLQKVALWVLKNATPIVEGEERTGDIYPLSPTYFALEAYHLQKYANESITDYVAPANDCSCNMALCERVFAGAGCASLPAGGDNSCDWFSDDDEGTCVEAPPAP